LVLSHRIHWGILWPGLAPGLLSTLLPVDTLLRKHLWIVDLLAVGVCAVFLGRAAASMVESKYLLSVALPRPAPHAVRTETDVVYPKAIDDVIKRNVFCSTCPPIVAVEPAPGPGNAGNLEPQKTTLPLQVLAVNYVAPPWGFEHASATLRDTETKFVGAFRPGDKVRGATITGIDETRVHLDNVGKPEYIDLLEPEANAATTPAVAAAPAAPPGGDAFSVELDRGIKKTGENTYEIQRATLESVLGNMSLLARSARIVPEMRDGKAAGFRLYSVRPDGPFAKIGMQNGDVLSAINGLEITSPEKALEVYSKLKSASHLSLGLERNGQRLTKDYSIR
jgi:general secretion pathway protein C